MKHEQAIKDIYKIAGMLEIMTCMQDHPLTSGMVAELIDTVDRLELIGAQLLAEDVNDDEDPDGIPLEALPGYIFERSKKPDQ